jgi:hypothetical protein
MAGFGGHGVPSPYAAERSLVTRQLGVKEPARRQGSAARETGNVRSPEDAVRRCTAGF